MNGRWRVIFGDDSAPGGEVSSKAENCTARPVIALEVPGSNCSITIKAFIGVLTR